MWVLGALFVLGILAVLLAFAVLGALQAGGTALLVVSGLMLVVLGGVTLMTFWFTLWFGTPRHDVFRERENPAALRKQIDSLRRELKTRDAAVENLERRLDRLQTMSEQSVANEDTPSYPQPAFHEEYDPDTGEFRAHTYAPARQPGTYPRVTPAQNGNGRNGHYHS